MKLGTSVILTLLIFSKAFSQQQIVVAKDGSGDFTTVQEAIHSVPDFRKNQTVIFIKKGVYKEKLTLGASKTNVKLIGEDKFTTILTYDDYASKKNRFGENIGTTGSTSFFIFGDDFTAENLTFENAAGPVGQAVAVRIDGDKVFFKNCRFLGFQDTLYPHGDRSRQYYRDCYIEGTVDFIFGSSTAVFDNCTIHCKQKGYITAASTNESSPYGFVFIDCTITGEMPNSFYLGRPWRPSAKVVFINCNMSDVIIPAGWNNWGKASNEQTAYYAEYKNKGTGFRPAERVPWSHQLSDQEVERYKINSILGDWQPYNNHD